MWFLPLQPGEVLLVRELCLAGPGVEVVLPVVPQVLTVEAVLTVLLPAGCTAVHGHPAVRTLLPLSLSLARDIHPDLGFMA